mgnify:CR=1 FL=1
MFELEGKFNNKVIAITGASGYIGSSLVNELQKHSIKKIICISRKKIKTQGNVEDWSIDLKDSESWLKIINQSDIIFHLSGNTSIAAAEKNPEKSLNEEILPIMNLVSASKELSKKPRVIYASTATIYGLTKKFPVSEEQHPSPITCYDSNKLSAEKKLNVASSDNIIESLSLRLANVYGPSLNDSSAADRGILSKITRLAFENKSIKIYGSGNYLRDYIYIDDVVRAFLYASVLEYTEAKKNSEIIFNVASGVGSSIKNTFGLIAEEIEKITGFKIDIESVSWPTGISEIEKRNFIGSAQRLKSYTNWNAKTSIEDGIHLLVNNISQDYL